MSRFDIVRWIPCKISHNISLCNPPIARKRFESLLMTLVDGQHIRQSSLQLVLIIQIMQYWQLSR